MRDVLSKPRRAIGLEDVPYDVFERITEYLPILDVKNLYATARIFYSYTHEDRAYFLRRRLVRHCKGRIRPLCFLIFLYHMEEIRRTGREASRRKVKLHTSRLRDGLATDEGRRGLYDSLQLLQNPEVLCILCGYMDTIDDMTDDFVSQILFPKLTRKSVHDRAERENDRELERCAPRWPVGPDISLSDAERARMQEGFLAYHILCILAKSGVAAEHIYMDQLSPLEIERIISIRGYFKDTWKELLGEPFRRPGWEEYGRCRFVRDGYIFHPRLINDFAYEGIPPLRQEFSAKKEGRERPIWFDEHWQGMVLSSQWRPFRPYGDKSRSVYLAISHYAVNRHSGERSPRLSPGEEERNDAEVTPVWKELKEEMKRSRWAWDTHVSLSSSRLGSSDWTLSELRERGWVFLDAANFEAVQKYWNHWLSHREDWGMLYFEDWRVSPGLMWAF